MDEIKEKDLEKAVGGVSGYDKKCERYTPKNAVFVNLEEKYKLCMTCAHYHRVDKQDICDLEEQ